MTGPQIPPHTHQNELFRFRPRWWWDPAPDWVLRALDDRTLRDLAVISLQYERAILDEQAKAIDQTISALKGR
jgi:hypothetical protein